MKLWLFIALFAATVACGTQAAAQTTFDEAQYLADIQAEATRTADINTRTGVLLANNEALWPTVQAYYSGVNEFQYATARMENIIATFAPPPQPTPVPPTPQVIVQQADLTQLSESEMRFVACQLLTVPYVDAWPGYSPTLANDIRARLGC